MNKSNAGFLKLIVKAAMMLVLVCFVLPVFTVSCGGESVNVSAAHSMVGYSVEGIGKVSDPVIILIVLLILPVIMLVIGGIMKNFSLGEGVINIVLALLELFGYMLFRSGVKNYAKNNACMFETNGWYYLAIGLCIGIIVGNVALFMTDRVSDAASSALYMTGSGQGINTTGAAPSGGWTCTCGNVLRDDDMFCGKCGNKKPGT